MLQWWIESHDVSIPKQGQIFLCIQNMCVQNYHNPRGSHPGPKWQFTHLNPSIFTMCKICLSWSREASNPKAKRLKWYVKAQIWADRATMWPHARLRAKTNWNARIELFPHRENTELNWQHIEYIFYQTFGADVFQTEISSSTVK